MEEINVYDHQLNDPSQVINELVLKKLALKHKDDHGIMCVQVEGRDDQFYPINDKALMEKGLKYYSKQEGTKALWFRPEDIKLKETVPV